MSGCCRGASSRVVLPSQRAVRCVQIPQRGQLLLDAACCLLQDEQNGKRLAASRGCAWVGVGWTTRQGRETGDRRAARRGASPLPVSVIRGPTGQPFLPLCGPLHAVRVVGRASRGPPGALCTFAFASLGLTFGGGGLMMCARGVSQDLFPVRTRLGRDCQIPHSAAAHLGTLQRVTARWIIAAPPLYWLETRRSATPAGPLGAASSGPFRPSVGP